jgi:hypothetical protein
MRWILIIAFLSTLSFSARSQYSDLVFYSEHGNSFYVFLNGALQNDTAAPIVKITNVVAPNYRCEIDFKNPRLYSIEKDLFFTPGLETNYVITKNKKNRYDLDFVSGVIRINDTIDIKYRQIVDYSNRRNKIKKVTMPFSESTTRTGHSVKKPGSPE